MGLKKSLLVIGGGVVSLVGAVIFVSPLPFGFAIILPGLAMLIMGSDKFADWVEQRRRNNESIDKKLCEAQEEAPDAIVKPLEKTDPEIGH